jgi:hypothetical protein
MRLLNLYDGNAKPNLGRAHAADDRSVGRKLTDYAFNV